MKFLDRDNGREIELNNIIGCTYWENKSGEIYAADRMRGYAWPINPAMALKTVLLRFEMRQNDKNDIQDEEYHLNALQRLLEEKKNHENKHLTNNI